MKGRYLVAEVLEATIKNVFEFKARYFRFVV